MPTPQRARAENPVVRVLPDQARSQLDDDPFHRDEPETLWNTLVGGSCQNPDISKPLTCNSRHACFAGCLAQACHWLLAKIQSTIRVLLPDKAPDLRTARNLKVCVGTEDITQSNMDTFFVFIIIIIMLLFPFTKTKKDEPDGSKLQQHDRGTAAHLSLSAPLLLLLLILCHLLLRLRLRQWRPLVVAVVVVVLVVVVVVRWW